MGDAKIFYFTILKALYFNHFLKTICTHWGLESLKSVSGSPPERAGLAAGVVPPFSPVRDPRLEWNGGLLSLDVDAPCN